MSNNTKPFTMQFTNAAGERVHERPRRHVSMDSTEHRLVVGVDCITLACAPIDEPVETLWAQAREKVLAQAAQ